MSEDHDELVPTRQLGLRTTTQLVVASMVGTGVFTGSGYLLEAVPSGPAVVLAWALGALLALTGALSYAELSAALPSNGGEYHLLGRIYHPRLGFAAGVLSVVVGFAGAIAAAAVGFGEYARAALDLGESWTLPLGVLSLLGAGALQALPVQAGARGQDALTAVKILLVIVLGVALVAFGEPARVLEREVSLGDAVWRPAFATGLVYVAFAYTGWNAAAYVAGEVEEPAKRMPKALLLGTAMVGALYLLLNIGFLAAAPLSVLRDTPDIAHVAVDSLAGSQAAKGVSGMIALGLLSTIGAMVVTGARVAEAMGQRDKRLRWLVRKEAGATPVRATVGIVMLSLAMALSGTLQQLLLYVGVTLSITALLTVAGVLVLRRNEPDLPRPYRTWGYPLTPLLFCGFSLWMVVFSVQDEPISGIAALVTIGVSAALYREG